MCEKKKTEHMGLVKKDEVDRLKPKKKYPL